ncbi:hypothetical protein OIV83_004784 [Microbotryomycetes sp. JL201]|nr:hypothetical protein OIV83_004784 [Microbotryomycetes sp. JL201]
MATVTPEPPAYIGSHREPFQESYGDSYHSDQSDGQARGASEFEHLADPNGEITLKMYRGKGALADSDEPVFYVDVEQENAWKKQAGVNFTLRSKSKDGVPLATVTKIQRRIEVALPQSNLYKCELTKSSLLSRSYELVGPPPDNAHFKWKISRLRPHYIASRLPLSVSAAPDALTDDIAQAQDWIGTRNLCRLHEPPTLLALEAESKFSVLRQSKEGLSNSPGVGYMGGGGTGAGGGGF